MTNTNRENKSFLKFDFNGYEKDAFFNKVLINGVDEIRIPASQSMDLVWGLILITGDSDWFHISGKATSVDGFNEYYHLSIKHINDVADQELISDEKFKLLEIQKFRVSSIDALAYEDESLYVEGGLRLNLDCSHAITVAVAPSPGAVVVSLEESLDEINSDLKFEPVHRFEYNEIINNS